MKVLIAEDSPTARDVLLTMLEQDEELNVCGIAQNGQEAVELCAELKPEVIVMDINMPVMNGFEATRLIMAKTPTPIVIVSGHSDVRETKVSFEALKAGALAWLSKPRGPHSERFEDDARHLISTLKAMAKVSVVRHRSFVALPAAAPSPPVFARKPAAEPPRVPQVVVIAASTGGPAVIHRILGDLSRSFPLPILIVQHIAEGFVRGMAASMSETLSRRVKLAAPEEKLEAGTIYLAPDGRHLSLSARGTIELIPRSKNDSFCPSANVLFSSAAESFGSGAVAVILTGMGSDGVEGMRAIKDHGGLTVAQDKSSCVVFGMPAEAIAAGLVDYVLSPVEISAWLTQAVSAFRVMPGVPRS